MPGTSRLNPTRIPSPSLSFFDARRDSPAESGAFSSSYDSQCTVSSFKKSFSLISSW